MRPLRSELPKRGPASYGYDRGDHRHAGVDVWAGPRSVVRSPVRGMVQVATYEQRPPWGGYAPVVVVRSADHRAEWHVLAHVAELLVREGDQVREGQPVARGSSVREGAPHVHWEIRRGRWWPKYGQGERPWDLSVNPVAWLAEREGSGGPTEAGGGNPSANDRTEEVDRG